jgi:endonuclease/exonuclease/phosphatase family metal-dependent hydrolase
MSTSVKIVTFNIRCCYDSFDGINSFVHRAGLVFDEIEDKKPDIICFQEALSSHASLLKRSLKSYTVIYNGRMESFDGEGLCIAIRDGVELMSHDFFWLSPTPRVPASRFEGDQSGCPRIATATMLRKDGSVFLVYNAHLDHIGEEARVKGASVLLGRVASDTAAYPVPAFVMGDFNDTPESRCIGFFKSFACPSLTDLTSDIKTTFHDFGRRSDDFKIDYVFASSDIAPSCTRGVIWDKVSNGIYLSDHYPVEIIANL